MKEYKDITLVCQETGVEFVWTAGEQKFYDEKGLTNQPKYCPEVRARRKAARDNRNFRNNRNDNRN